RLSGPVRADDADDCTGCDAKRKRVERADPAELADDAGQFDRVDHFASGFGRTWKCAASGLVPLPPSMSHGVRSPFADQIPRAFQPPFGSSMRPSRPFA